MSHGGRGEKRPRPSDEGTSEEPMDASGGNSGSSSGGSGESGGGPSGSGTGGKGMPILPIDRPIKSLHSDTQIFEKCFKFKWYMSDWKIGVESGGGGDQYVRGFMNVIPWQALCMYMSPDEYMHTIRSCEWAKIESALCQVDIETIRTPFLANTETPVEANNLLDFQFHEWRGLEKMLPFDTVDVNADLTHTYRQSYIELIQRLYGQQSFASGFASVTTDKLPATMQQRGMTFRPIWLFNINPDNQHVPGTSSDATPTESEKNCYFAVNQAISSLPIYEYVTDSWSSKNPLMQMGCYSKQWGYQPKNGIIGFKPSARERNTTIAWLQNRRERINTKIRYDMEINNGTNTAGNMGMAQFSSLFGEEFPQTELNNPLFRLGGQNNSLDLDPTDTAVPAAVTAGAMFPSSGVANIQDSYSIGSRDGMAFYTVANLEAFDCFTSNNDPPIMNMPSWMIGTTPKINTDGSIVNGIIEFTVRTKLKVNLQKAHKTYMQLGYNVFPNDGAIGDNVAGQGFVDPTWNNSQYRNPFAFTLLHNENDVLLGDNKVHYANNFGNAGKPLFYKYPTTNIPIRK